jgi:small subunit ribosomal protein S9
MPTTIKKVVKKAEKKNQYYEGLGRRKRAIARVRIHSNGHNLLKINDKDIPQVDADLIEILNMAGLNNKFDITVKVNGGGINGQKGAIKLGLTRALVIYDEKLRPTFRKTGFLTRDPREKERKKPGLRRARRAPQWAKR